MSASRTDSRSWPRVKELFWAALERDAASRAAFLDQACGGDARLRSDVESLLAAHQTDAGFIEPPRFGAVSRLLHDEPPAIGRQIGAYRIERLIASGGMGSVYLATRADEQYQATVAVKLIREGAVGPAAVRRFLHERQTLARLNHPNIARLYDGGVTDGGQPYLVMEYIDGRPIDEFCDERRLATRERLHLFREVCAAVQYAHQNLVVHRDLKPGNILVTTAGVPKLLDFGIAKVLDDAPIAAGCAVTTIQRAMTPYYASPEQVRGQPMTTASDIYSLGVILYELLTGQRPYAFDTPSLAEMERIICQTEPPTPSTSLTRATRITRERPATRAVAAPDEIGALRSATARKLRDQLHGDLDNIVMMAMRKEPQRRYASVGQLAEDIRRHLAGLPIMARPNTLTYVAGRFARRNRVAVSAAALLLLALLAGLVSTIWERNVALANLERARLAEQAAEAHAARARTEAETAGQTLEFLLGLFKSSDPTETGPTNPSAREILDEGARRVETELKEQPEVQATLMNAIGNVYYELGMYEPARSLLSEALAIRRARQAQSPKAVAETLANLANTRRAVGEFSAADPMFREAVDLYRALLESQPQRASSLATALDNWAGLLVDKGDYARAEVLEREALELTRRLPGEPGLAAAVRLNNLGEMLRNQGKPAQAEPLYRESLSIFEARLGASHLHAANVLNNLGLVSHAQDRLEEAEELHRRALEIQRAARGTHPETACSLNNLAGVLRRQGRTDEAEPLYRESLEMYRATLPPDHPDVARSLNNLGMVLTDAGEFEEAETCLRAALSIRRKRFGEDHPLAVQGLSNVAVLLISLDRLDEAEPLLDRARTLCMNRLGADHADVAQVLAYQARLYSRRGDEARAEFALCACLSIRERSLPPDDPRTLTTVKELGECLAAQGRLDEAESRLLEALQRARRAPQPSQEKTREMIQALARLYERDDRPEDAAAYRALLGPD